MGIKWVSKKSKAENIFTDGIIFSRSQDFSAKIILKTTHLEKSIFLYP